MDNRIGVSKAARLLGIKRSELNQRLLAAGIETFEGEVDLEKVKCIAPVLNIGDQMLERIEYIRENTAHAPSRGPGKLRKQDLTNEIQRLTTEVMVQTRTVQNYEHIFAALAEKLGHLQALNDGERSEMAFQLCEWLREEISSS